MYKIKILRPRPKKRQGPSEWEIRDRDIQIRKKQNDILHRVK